MFGMTDDMRQIAMDKIRRQKKYLSENGVEFAGQSIQLIDFFKNAYINSHRYIAEINNRVSSLYRYSQEKNLSNVFVTITLPSEYHSKKSIYSKAGKLVKVIDNPRWIDDEYHSPRAGARELSRIFKRLQDLRAYRDIPTDQKAYFRVYEPHKDGTPHLHASIFIPADRVDAFKRSAERWAEQNGLEQFKIETDIKNPVAYLMKYILKTFDDLRQNRDTISDLTLWYVYYGICRFYTSRTLISLEIYKKFRGAFDLLDVTKMYKNHEFSVLVDEKNKPVMIYTDTHVIYNRKPVKIVSKSYQSVPKEWKFKEKPYIPSEIDGEPAVYNVYSGKITKLKDIKRPVARMSDYDLLYEYQNFDFDRNDPKRFGLTRRELYERGLITDAPAPLDEYNTDFYSGVIF